MHKGGDGHLRKARMESESGANKQASWRKSNREHTQGRTGPKSRVKQAGRKQGSSYEKISGRTKKKVDLGSGAKGEEREW